MITIANQSVEYTHRGKEKGEPEAFAGASQRQGSLNQSSLRKGRQQPWGERHFRRMVAELVKNPPAMWETRVQSLGWEDPLVKGTASHPSILAWRIPRTVQPMGSQSQTRLSDFHIHTHGAGTHRLLGTRAPFHQGNLKLPQTRHPTCSKLPSSRVKPSKPHSNVPFVSTPSKELPVATFSEISKLSLVESYRQWRE